MRPVRLLACADPPNTRRNGPGGGSGADGQSYDDHGDHRESTTQDGQSAALTRVLSKLEEWRFTGDQYMACCPAHDDEQPSLAIREADDGRVLLYCHAGCETEDILEVVDLTFADLRGDSGNEQGDVGRTAIKRRAGFKGRPVNMARGRIVATYDYQAADGRSLFQKVRIEPKDFRYRRPLPDGSWEWKLGDVERVLYRLSEVIEAVKNGDPIYLVEGEKDADRAASLGYVATCNCEGASVWLPAYGDALKGAHVRLIVDDDEPGFNHGKAIYEDLHGKAASIQVYRTAVNHKGADLSDHLDAGHSIDDLIPVALDKDSRPTISATTTTGTSWSPINLSTYMYGEVAPAQPGILTRTDGVGLLYRAKVHWFYGQSESGKSWGALLAVAAVLRAGGWVLFLDFESDPQEIADRLRLLGVSVIDVQRLVYIRPDEPFRKETVATFAEALSRDYDLAIIDGITDALGLVGASTVDTDQVAYFVREMPRRIARETGAAVVCVDHVTKDPERAGRFPLGSQAKLAGVDGAAYTVEAIEPLGRGLVGKIELRVAKDRPGAIRRYGGPRRADGTQVIAHVVLDGTDDDRVTWSVLPPNGSAAGATAFPWVTWPEELMERVSRFLEAQPGQQPTGAIKKAVGGNAQRVTDALKILTQEGYVDQQTSGQAKLCHSVKPFRTGPRSRSGSYRAGERVERVGGTHSGTGTERDGTGRNDQPPPGKTPGTGHGLTDPFPRSGTGRGQHDHVEDHSQDPDPARNSRVPDAP